MRDLGVGEIGVFRRRPNAQCHTPSRILHGIWAVGRLRGGLRGGLWVAGWVVVCVAERAWRRGDESTGMMQRGAVESRPAAPSPRSSFAAASARASSIGSLGALLEESSSS